jgi:hypothetical protein
MGVAARRVTVENTNTMETGQDKTSKTGEAACSWMGK